MRAVEDDDVDRPQVQAWRHVQPSGTNSPMRLERSVSPPGGRDAERKKEEKARHRKHYARLLETLLQISFRLVLRSLPYSGDDSTRAPPLPIPNREVKPCNADGTAKAGEQVIAVLLRADSKESALFYSVIG